MYRTITDGYVLDDDPSRVDRDRVCRFLQESSYWARDRPREIIEASIEGSDRVIGLYRDSVQVGFARVVSDGATQAYLADLYVEEDHRGRGLGKQLVAEAVDRGPHKNLKWLLHTADANELYQKYGFGPASTLVMERRR